MALGKGLDALIPKKNNNSNFVPQPKNQPPASVSPLPALSQSVNYPTPAQNANSQKPKHLSNQESIFQIEVDKIKPNPYQPRKEFDVVALDELAASLREHGVIQPLLVAKVIKETPNGTQVEYQLIAGERRLMAAKKIGLPRVPVIIKKFETNQKKLEVALIENLQRSNLNAIETAKAYARLQDEFGLTQKEIAVKAGKSREAVANTLRLLNLPSEIQGALSTGKINESQARAMLGVTDVYKQNEVFQNVLKEKQSVRELKKKITPEKESTNPEQIMWEKQLEEKFGAPVQIIKEGNKGKMVVKFYSEDELRGILQRFLGES